MSLIHHDNSEADNMRHHPTPFSPALLTPSSKEDVMCNPFRIKLDVAPVELMQGIAHLDRELSEVQLIGARGRSNGARVHFDVAVPADYSSSSRT